MKRTSTFAVLCLTAAVPACTSDGADHAALLAGVWTGCDDATASFTFGADGSVAFDETVPDRPDEHWTGTFAVDATTVSIDAEDQDGAAVDYVFTYYIIDERLVVAAAFPDGTHDGVVGTWRSRVHLALDGEPVSGGDDELELRADGTGIATTVLFDGGAEERYEGTWSDDDDGVG